METPKSIIEAIRMVKEDIQKEKSVYEIAVKDPDKFAVQTHHAYGRWLRNEWGLWVGGELCNEFIAMGISHPDDMSGYIIKKAAQELKKEKGKEIK